MGGDPPVQQLQAQSSRSLHVGASDAPGVAHPAVPDGVEQGVVLVERILPAVPDRQGGVWGVNGVRGEPIEEVFEHPVMRSRPEGGVELEVGGDLGLVVRPDQGTVLFHQSLQAHEVGRPPVLRSLARRLLFEHDPHVIDLDDLLRVEVRNLQAADRAFQQPFVLQPPQRLPTGVRETPKRSERLTSRNAAPGG